MPASDWIGSKIAAAIFLVASFASSADSISGRVLAPSAGIGAVLMSDAVNRSVYDSLKRSIVHTSTYSENGLAMRAGIATLDVVRDESLTTAAARMGDYVRERLHEQLGSYEMIKEIRGVGLSNGIEFTAPQSIKLRLALETLKQVHAGMFGQMVVMRLFREKNILTRMCGNNFMVLKAAPPLTVTEEQVDKFVASMREVVELIHTSASFWTDAVGLA